MTTPSASGLDGVVVAETALSDVDGERGRLLIRGYPVEELVERATFEDVCGLMWNGSLPSIPEREALRAALAGARREAFALLPSLGNALSASDSMEALRAAAGHVPASGDLSEGALRLTGALSVFAAAWARAQRGPAAGAATAVALARRRLPADAVGHDAGAVARSPRSMPISVASSITA